MASSLRCFGIESGHCHRNQGDVPCLLRPSPMRNVFKRACSLALKSVSCIGSPQECRNGSTQTTGPYLVLSRCASSGHGYYLCQWTPIYLHIVNVALVIDWFGDSMDGTLARCRDMKRPRYGFYVDHICDAFGTVFILTGLALSGYLSTWVAWAILTVYLVMSINVYLATYTIGTFTLSFGRLSPTEGRVLLALFNLVLLYNPVLLVYGMSFPVSDVIGLLVILVLLAMLIHSVLMNTLTLYRAEPLRGNQ